MRAAVVHAFGKPPRVEEFRSPEPGSDAQVAQVLAAGLNPSDLRTASGTFYGEVPDLPYVAGAEGVGLLPDGSQVYFDRPLRPFGSFAEATLLPSGTGIALPEETDPALAIACGVAGLAGWLAVESIGDLRAGETVLVLGASGAVGQIALQAAKLLGAGRVVAAARSPAGLELAARLGADATVDLQDHDLAATFAAACRDGFDLVVDPLWGEPATAAVQAMSAHGRLVQLGESAGPSSALESKPIRSKMLEIRGLTNVHADPAAKRDAYRRMLAYAASGQLIAVTEQVPLDRVADAWSRQSRSPGCKLVLVP